MGNRLISEMRYMVCDLKLENIMINEDKEIKVIDVDICEVGEFNVENTFF